MLLAPEYFTTEMVRSLPDDGTRRELVFGELLVTPAPSWMHQQIVSVLIHRLVDHCQRHDCGRAFTGPADISWGEDTLVRPDVFVVPPSEASVGTWSRVTTLSLVAEVLSPGTAHHDRFQKRKLYQMHGVHTLWLVDAGHRSVEVWTPDAMFPRIESERVEWHPAGESTALVIRCEELFG